jgi:hypothetical protein
MRNRCRKGQMPAPAWRSGVAMPAIDGLYPGHLPPGAPFHPGAWNGQSPSLSRRQRGRGPVDQPPGPSPSFPPLSPSRSGWARAAQFLGNPPPAPAGCRKPSHGLHALRALHGHLQNQRLQRWHSSTPLVVLVVMPHGVDQFSCRLQTSFHSRLTPRASPPSAPRRCAGVPRFRRQW